MAKIKVEYFLLFLSVINEVRGNVGASSGVNELSITPYKTYRCGDVEEGIHYTVTDIPEKDNERFVDIEYTLEEEFNQYWKLRMEVEQLVNGVWVGGRYYGGGPVCDMITMYFPGPWKRLKDLSEPSISDECFAPPGKYKVKGFYGNKDECDRIPITEDNTGTFRIIVSLDNEFDNAMFCHIVETNVKRA